MIYNDIRSLNKYTFKKNKLDYFLFYFLFFFPVLNWTSLRRETYYVQFIIAFLLALRNKNFISLTFIRVLILWIVVILLQVIYFKIAPIESYVGQLMFISYPYFMIIIFKEKIPHYFINVVVFIAIISFFFYFPSLVSSKIHGLIYNFSSSLGLDVFHHWKTSFIIYTWEPMNSSGLIRNAGAFAEPGYFGCYLLMALVWNLIYSQEVGNVKNCVLLLAIITTFSTAAYLASYFVLAYWMVANHRTKKIYVLLGVPILLTIICFSYIKLEFMSQKLTRFYGREKYVSTTVRGRFGATLKNIEQIMEYPLTGRGLIRQTNSYEMEEYGPGKWGNTNSWSAFMVRLGIIGFIFFMVWYVNSIRRYILYERLPPKYFYLIIGTLFISLSSQPILLTPAFFSFVYFKEIGQTKKVRKNARAFYRWSKVHTT